MTSFPKYRATRKKIEEIFVKRIGKEVSEIKKIPEGIVNASYEVKAGNRSYVLRIASRGKPDNFSREAFAFRKWKKAKVPVPTVCAVDTSHKIIRTNYMIAQKKQGVQLETYLKDHPEKARDLCRELGEHIRKMHSVKTEGYWFIENGRGIRENWTRELENSFREKISEGRSMKVISSDEADIFSHFFDNHLSSLVCHDPVLVHNDLNFGNILTNGRRITGILDAEWCLSGDPMMEFGNIISIYYPEKGWTDSLLKGYFQGKRQNYKKIHTYAFYLSVFKMVVHVKDFGRTIKKERELFMPIIEDIMHNSHK